MSTEIKTWRARSAVLDRLRGWKRAYETRIVEGYRQVVGRGPTSEASQEADVEEPTAADGAFIYPQRNSAEHSGHGLTDDLLFFASAAVLILAINAIAWIALHIGIVNLQQNVGN
ncbi:MAG: hypothetical protein WB662_03975 [Methyloceanibacter sp.]